MKQHCKAFIQKKCDCLNGICYNFKPLKETLTSDRSRPMDIACRAFKRKRNEK